MLALLPSRIAQFEEEVAQGNESARVVANALYESLLVHARVLDDFLANRGNPNRRGVDRSATARSFAPRWVSSDARPAWRVSANTRVAHLDWVRTAPIGEAQNLDWEEIYASVGSQLLEFSACLPDARKPWFSFIQTYLGERGRSA